MTDREEVLFEIADLLKVPFTREGAIVVFQKYAFLVRDFSQSSNRNLTRTPRKLFEEYKNRGIQLFQLSTDVSAIKLLYFMKAKLQLNQTIFARKCSVIVPSKEEYLSFCAKHHIQGAANSSEIFGLGIRGKMVGAIGFVKSSENTWNLNRLCFADVTVVGGAAKLLKAFQKKYPSAKIETWSNNGYASGEIYSRLGFTRGNEESSDMWYISPEGSLLNRRGLQKKKLERKLVRFDSNLTEKQNLFAAGVDVYFGPGTVKWTLG